MNIPTPVAMRALRHARREWARDPQYHQSEYGPLMVRWMDEQGEELAFARDGKGSLKMRGLLGYDATSFIPRSGFYVLRALGLGRPLPEEVGDFGGRTPENLPMEELFSKYLGHPVMLVMKERGFHPKPLVGMLEKSGLVLRYYFDEPVSWASVSPSEVEELWLCRDVHFMRKVANDWFRFV